MRWNFRHVLAILFAVEGAWLIVRNLVYIAEGSPLHVPWLVGLLLGPVSFLGASWFVRRSQPPTLLLAAIARTLVLFVAIAWNLLLVGGIATGHFTLI